MGIVLPTEAEWKKAARDGVNGQLFSWVNTISESQANYYGCTYSYSYDLRPNGNNAAFTNGVIPIDERSKVDQAFGGFLISCIPKYLQADIPMLCKSLPRLIAGQL
jgi:Sulfatase-modifying factor enzyme 1